MRRRTLQPAGSLPDRNMQEARQDVDATWWRNVDTGNQQQFRCRRADGVHVPVVTGLVVQEPEAHSHDQGDPSASGTFRDGVGGQRGEVLVQGADGGTAGRPGRYCRRPAAYPG